MESRSRLWHEPIPELIDATLEQAIVRSASTTGHRSDTGQRAGSASRRRRHPMLASLGQGACQAIEDAAALGDAVGAGSDATVALQAYGASRAPHAAAVVRRSHRVARLAHLRHPLAVAAGDAFSAGDRCSTAGGTVGRCQPCVRGSYHRGMLHGRHAECAAIDRLLADASEPRSGALVVRGEVGVGKSALLTYAADRAGEDAGAVGAGVESESELAFAALHQLVRPVLDHIERLPGPQAAALWGAFGLATSQGTDRFLIGVGALSLLAEVAEERPLVCLVDDAQWLDQPSTDALSFAARRLEAEGIALLVAARDDDLHAFTAPSFEELRLNGLDADAAGALLTEQFPADSRRMFARA